MNTIINVFICYLAINAIFYFIFYYYTIHECKYGNELESKTADYIIRNVFENGLMSFRLILYGVPQILFKYIYSKMFNRK